MKIDLTKIKSSRQIADTFPKLFSSVDIAGGYKVLPKEINVELFKFMIYFYSEDSPLNIPPQLPFDDRKVAAAHKAGLEVDSMVENDYFNFGSQPFLQMVVGYLIFLKYPLWTQIMVDEQRFHSNMTLLMAPDTKIADALNKEKLSDVMGDLRKKVENNYRTFFAENTDANRKLFEYGINNILDIAKPVDQM